MKQGYVITIAESSRDDDDLIIREVMKAVYGLKEFSGDLRIEVTADDIPEEENV